MAKGKKRTKPTGLSAFLADNASQKKTKKKGNPELCFRQEADQVFHAKLALEEAKANFQTVERNLLELVSPEYEAHAERDEFSKTFEVAGQDTPGVQVSFKDAFHTVPLDKEQLLKKKLGEKYNYFFYQKRNICLADTSDATIRVLLAKLGEEDFKKFFKIEMCVATRQDMDRKQFELSAEVRLVVQQYKPSLKLRKK